MDDLTIQYQDISNVRIRTLHKIRDYEVNETLKSRKAISSDEIPIEVSPMGCEMPDRPL